LNPNSLKARPILERDCIMSAFHYVQAIKANKPIDSI
jgi:hypothetical protein